MITTLLSFFLISSLSAQRHQIHSTNERISDTTNFIIIDTIEFEGLMVLDQINDECYFIKSDRLTRVRLDYKNGNRFKKEFKKKQKLNFIDSYAAKSLITKYYGQEFPDELYWLHHPIINSNSIYKADNEKEIFLSLYHGRLVRMRISIEVLEENNIPHIENQRGEDVVYFYSLL